MTASAVLVMWARTLPSFDAYGWLAWGERTWHRGLDTNAAPSWKPLPYLFTALYAPTGRDLELRLWMVTAAAIAFAGVVFAGRLAYRLTAPEPDRRWPGWVAAGFAGLALLCLHDELGYGYLHYVFSSQSDPIIVTFVLAAIDLGLSGRLRAAFACGLLASLGRPETWPLLAIYSIWLWVRAQPGTRTLICCGWAALAALWFGIPALTARTPFVAAANALDSGRAPTGDRITAVLARFGDLQPWPIYLAAALSVLGAAVAMVERRTRGRDRVTLALAAGIAIWVVVEIACGLHGWPALGRYMFEPAAVATVLAGALIGRALMGDWAKRPGDRPARTWAGPAVAALLVAAVLPAAVAAVRNERADLIEQHARTAEIDALPGVVARLGGAELLHGCGEPLTRLQYQSALAYALGDNVSQVGFKYSQALAHGNPELFVTPFESGVGWQVQAADQTARACAALPRNPTNLG